jgi:non-homologous end joining protein Ku
MADFQEWFDAAGGGGGFGAGADDGVKLFDDGAGDDDSASSFNNRDAVLFCVDCHSSSFSLPPDAPPGTPPPFRAFLKHALRFYQDKILTSDRDLVGLVLFGTEQQCNAHGFPNIYVFHELDLNSAARVQELELLASAATPGATLAAEFKTKIGHADVKREADGTTTAKPRAALSEVLWAVLHMFNYLGTKKVAFKRAFLFTCDDDPVSGSAVERAKCFARARDLQEHGIFLDVYGHGMDFAPVLHMSSGTPLSQDSLLLGSARVVLGGSGHRGDSGPRSGSPFPAIAVSGPSLTPPAAAPADGFMTAYQPPILTSTTRGSSPAAGFAPGVGTGHSVLSAGGAAAGATAAAPPTVAAVAAGLRPFDRRLFWDKLISSGQLEPATRASAGHRAERSSSIGSVHVGDLSDATFAGSLSEHRIRTYPQRALGTLMMSVGSEATAPALAVSIFLPIVPCPKPKFVWLEASTNALVTSEGQMLAKESGTPVTPEDLVYTAKIGAGDSVVFTADEVNAIKKRFGPPGIRILGFRAESQLRSKWTIGKSSFLVPNEDACGHNGLVLFKELHKNLSKTKRFAIAEVIARNGAQPRLAALIAATDANTSPYAVERGSTGFHLFPLPYADDYRTLSFPEGTFVPPPSDGAVSKARQIVQKLTVEFDPTAVPNPALQRQYHLLQQLAVMDDEQKPPEDLSLPDREGMKAFGDLFKEFMGSWGAAAETYSPDSFAPLPKAAKPPPSADEMASIDVDGLAQAGQLSTLTIPFLKKFLQDNHESTSGLKKDLVDRVTQLCLKRAEKKAREAAAAAAAGTAAS